MTPSPDRSGGAQHRILRPFCNATTISVTWPGSAWTQRYASPALNGRRQMSAQQNKKTAQDAYAAFSNSDAEGAMRDIDDSITWTEGGDNALTGTHHGKQ